MGSASKAKVSPGGGELNAQQVEQIIQSDVFKKALSKQSKEIVDLKKRIQSLEEQNRELKEGLTKQERLRPSMMKSLEQHQEAFKLISKLSSQVN
jgi:cell division protein FtsB